MKDNLKYIKIRADDVSCIIEMSKDLNMRSRDFITLLVNDAAKTILMPTLPSLCQIMLTKKIANNNEIKLLDEPKNINSIL